MFGQEFRIISKNTEFVGQKPNREGGVRTRRHTCSSQGGPRAATGFCDPRAEFRELFNLVNQSLEVSMAFTG